VAPDALALTSQELLVGYRTDDPELRRGLAFGDAEADRSGRLFGWRISAHDLTSNPRASVHAIVVDTGESPRLAAPVPVLRTSCAHATDPWTFTLVACESRGDVWHRSLEKFGAAQLNDRYAAAMSQPMTPKAWLGWFAMKILAESAWRARSTDARAIADQLRTLSFDGHKGIALRFDDRQVLRDVVYEVRGEGPNARVVREIVPAQPRP